MNYEVKMACGHVDIVALYGKMADRERRIAWMEKNRICHHCYEAEQMANVEAIEKEFSLPALSGSEKQVAWARKIRWEKFLMIKDYIKFDWGTSIMTEDEAFAEDHPSEGRIADFKKYLAGKDSARYWIDHRDKPMRALGREFMKEVNGYEEIYD